MKKTLALAALAVAGLTLSGVVYGKENKDVISTKKSKASTADSSKSSAQASTAPKTAAQYDSEATALENAGKTDEAAAVRKCADAARKLDEAKSGGSQDTINTAQDNLKQAITARNALLPAKGSKSADSSSGNSKKL
jgi:hypothetical protein